MLFTVWHVEFSRVFCRVRFDAELLLVEDTEGSEGCRAGKARHTDQETLQEGREIRAPHEVAGHHPGEPGDNGALCSAHGYVAYAGFIRSAISFMEDLGHIGELPV